MRGVLNNQCGGSLIGTIVSVAIMGTVMVAMMSFTSHQFQAVGYLEDKLSSQALEGELRVMMLTNKQLCQQFFNNIQVPQPQQQRLIASSSNALNPSHILKVMENVFSYDQLQFSQIHLRNVNIPGPSSSGTLEVTLPLERKRSGGGPKFLKPITFQVVASTDHNFKVQSCTLENQEDSKKECRLSEAFHAKGFKLPLSSTYHSVRGLRVINGSSTINLVPNPSTRLYEWGSHEPNSLTSPNGQFVILQGSLQYGGGCTVMATYSPEAGPMPVSATLYSIASDLAQCVDGEWIFLPSSNVSSCGALPHWKNISSPPPPAYTNPYNVWPDE